MSEHDAPSAREWETALDRLEVQLNRAERMGTTVDPKDLELGLPASLNTIPRYLLDRAQVLVERQQRLVRLFPTPEPEPEELEEPEALRAPVDSWQPQAARGGTLHERVGHLITGPREPVSFDLFGAPTEGERQDG
jgi:hypothetical protein